MRPPQDLRFDNPGGSDQIANTVAKHGWREFEPPLPDFLQLACRRRPGLVVDVGANTGFYSLLAASANVRNRVLAFEPVAGIREIAARNLTLNDLSARVTLSGIALSDRNGTARLYVPPGDHGLVETSASLEADFKSSHSGTLEVATRRLDRILFGPTRCWRRVSVLKIDVEGHEAAVLDGGIRTLRFRRPIVFVEILPGSDLQRLRQIIRRSGYVPLKLYPDRTIARAPSLEHDPASWNQALVPNERLADFLDSAREIAGGRA